MNVEGILFNSTTAINVIITTGLIQACASEEMKEENLINQRVQNEKKMKTGNTSHQQLKHSNLHQAPCSTCSTHSASPLISVK